MKIDCWSRAHRYFSTSAQTMAEFRRIEIKDLSPKKTEAAILAIIKQLDDADLAKCRKGVEDLDHLDPVESRRAIPALVRALQRHLDEGFRGGVEEVVDASGRQPPT